MLEKYKINGEDELSPDVFQYIPNKLEPIKKVYTKEK